MARAPFQILVLPFRRCPNGSVQFAVFHCTDGGFWQGIAGGGEDSETPLDAAKREAAEEAGIPATADWFALRSMSSVPVYYFHGNEHWPENQYVVPEYAFAVACSEAELALSREHTEYRWVSYEEALSLLRYDSNKTALWELQQRIVNDDLPRD
jgi:dihydroneopterin triphosphate diphosphatase